MCRVPERPVSAPMRMPISGIYKIKGASVVFVRAVSFHLKGGGCFLCRSQSRILKFGRLLLVSLEEPLPSQKMDYPPGFG